MTNARTIYLFVNGIATWPGNYTNWNKRAVTFTHTRTEHRAEAFEYFCTPLTRPFREDQRAKQFARSLAEYSKLGWNIVCVGHSNGAAVIIDGLRAAGWPEVTALHLVCGACEADFWKNGLGVQIYRGSIGRVCVYCAEQDWALRLAHTIPAKLLGYGTLGLHGAQNLSPGIKDKVGELWWPNYGHSSCWLPDNFDRTMRHFFPADRDQAQTETYGGKHLMSRNG
jgi:hypothetical protein